jgi:hypothetical protein
MKKVKNILLIVLVLVAVACILVPVRNYVSRHYPNAVLK